MAPDQGAGTRGPGGHFQGSPEAAPVLSQGSKGAR